MSPVVGVVLMVALTLVLASLFAAGVTSFGSGLDEKEDQFDEAVSTASGNPWTGERGDLIRPANDRAGATDVTYRVNFTIEPGSNTIGNSLNSIYLDVNDSQSPDMFSNTERSDVVKVVVDHGSDGTVDETITGDINGWQVSNGGTTLKIEFSGSAYTPQADDSIVAVFDGVDNPASAGTYDLRAQTSGDGNWHSGTITIV